MHESEMQRTFFYCLIVLFLAFQKGKDAVQKYCAKQKNAGVRQRRVNEIRGVWPNAYTIHLMPAQAPT